MMDEIIHTECNKPVSIDDCYSIPEADKTLFNYRVKCYHCSRVFEAHETIYQVEPCHHRFVYSL